MFNATKTDVNALCVKFDVSNPRWEQWGLLRSDVHHDNVHCNQKLEKEHLDEAKEKGAFIIDTGDLFCAMQGKYDKRSDKSVCRPEHQTGDYLDALVRTAADFYEPYADNFLIMGKGNHETAIQKRHETDLNQRLIATLNDRTGSHIHHTGYTGWVRFQFSRRSGARGSKALWYTHGYGGGGPVTEDMIQSSRQRVYIENADIMLSGHVHRSWVQEFVRQRMGHNGKIERREGYYLKLPTYKDEYGKGVDGFAVEKGHGPRPLGAYWIRFYRKNHDIKMQVIKAG